MVWLAFFVGLLVGASAGILAISFCHMMARSEEYDELQRLHGHRCHGAMPSDSSV